MANLGLAILLLAVCSASPIEYRVVGVVDGDTVLLNKGKQTMSLNLAYIDAPELGRSLVSPCQPFAKKAKRYLEDRVLGKRVKVVMRNPTVGNEPAGILFLEGKNINLEMVKSGLAEVALGAYPPDTSQRQYLIAQREAWSAARGLWGLGKRRICPKKWRQRCKERSAFAALLYILVSQPKK